MCLSYLGHLCLDLVNITLYRGEVKMKSSKYPNLNLALHKRLCKINPKYECHRQVFSGLSQKAQPNEPKHCSALLLHNASGFLQKMRWK